MSTVVKETVLIEDCTVANLVWRKFGRQPSGYVEAVLDLNPGISANIFIPVGTVISFPIEEVTVTVSETAVVRLWD